MSGAEHYREAERLLALAVDGEGTPLSYVDADAVTVAAAQVHATLALAAATAYPGSASGPARRRGTAATGPASPPRRRCRHERRRRAGRPASVGDAHPLLRGRPRPHPQSLPFRLVLRVDAEGYACTWPRGHTHPQHVAGDGHRVCAVWPVDPDQPLEDPLATALAERDRARTVAVALEQDHARLIRDLRAVADDLDESGQRYAALRITRALAGGS